MKKPLRKRIADAIKVLKGEHLPMDVPIPKLEISHSEVKTVAVRHIYPDFYFASRIPKEELRKRAEEKLCYELAQHLMREGVIQFREDAAEPALFARVRVVMPKGE